MRRDRRVRRGRPVRFLLLAVAAVVLSSCALTSHPSTSTPRVFGQPRGTPLVVGQPAPAGSGQLAAVSCPTVRRCWAVGVAGPNPPTSPTGTSVIVATTNGGSSWKAQFVTGGSTPQLSGVSCPTSTQCMAVGSNGSSLPGSGVVVTTEDGRTWTPATAPANVLAMTAVTCASPTDCTAIVSSGTATWSAHSGDFGMSWQQEGNLPASFDAGDDLSCAPGGTCLVAGYVPTSNGHGQGALAISSDGGQSWALASVPSDAGILRTATCLSATECLAAGSTSTTVSDVVPAKGLLLQSADGGHTWTSTTGSVPVEDVYGLACPSSRLCAMVGTFWIGYPAAPGGAVAQSGDGGDDFRLSSSAYIPTTLLGLSCPTTVACVAVGGGTVARLTLITPSPATSRSTTTTSSSTTTSSPSTATTSPPAATTSSSGTA